MKHISEIAKANATAAGHIQRHGPQHLESCQECGKDFQTRERFQRLCPPCDAVDKRQHEQAHRSSYRRDEFSVRRRAQATDLEVATGELVGQACPACDELTREGQRVIANRDNTGAEGRPALVVFHAVCPSPFDAA